MKVPSFLKKPLWILLFILAILWLPSLFEPIAYGDECIYFVLGQGFRQGLNFYKDIHDNKPPFLYLMAALSFGKVFWFRFYSLIWNALHLVIIYRLSLKLAKNKIAAISSSFLFIFLLLIFEGRVANGETFMMMPATLAVYLLLDKSQLAFFKKKKASRFLSGLVIGLLFSLGFLFKVPLGFDFAAVVLVFFFFKLKSFSKKEVVNLVTDQNLWGAIIGFVAPIILSIGFYTLKGAFTPYVRSALLQNIGYLSTWGGSNLSLYIRFLLLILSTLILFFFRKKIPFEPLALFVWFLYGLFGALLSGRPYPHYLVEIVPQICLLFALAIKKRKGLYLVFPLISASLIILAYSYFNFWWYPQIPYYQNFLQYLSGQKNKQEYYAFWGEKVLSDYRLADFIQKSTDPHEPIFVWGDAACAYATAKRLPPGRYTVNYHIYDFNGFEETLSAINKAQPKLIIKLKGEQRSWPELNTLLYNEYIPLSLPGIKDQVYLRQNENH
ncbi:glycosyltransferase family 39 protein [Candidatus Shapirobacteria bacterium]|nr:glycosyltransferase family 39 protein [Candidatus Shapirobacteria bacterium]